MDAKFVQNLYSKIYKKCLYKKVIEQNISGHSVYLLKMLLDQFELKITPVQIVFLPITIPSFLILFIDIVHQFISTMGRPGTPTGNYQWQLMLGPS